MTLSPSSPVSLSLAGSRQGPRPLKTRYHYHRIILSHSTNFYIMVKSLLFYLYPIQFCMNASGSFVQVIQQSVIHIIQSNLKGYLGKGGV